jgi:hypothetical protein
MKSTQRLTFAIAAFIFSVFFIPAFGQNKDTIPSTDKTISLGDQVKLKIGGFLRSDVYFDTRKNVEIVDGLLDLLPKGESLDYNLKDVNAVSSLRMAATASRINMKFTGPDALNAKTSSYVEFDFTGVNGIGLRVRHLWVKLNWEKSELLFGRYWHPFFIVDAMPSVLALSTGAPFAVFNRSEQVRYTHFWGPLSVMAAASTQMDYGYAYDFSSSTGKSNYLHNSLLPDLTVNTQYKSEAFLLGFSGNYKQNQPRISVTSVKSKLTSATSEKISSMALETYAQVSSGSFKIKGSLVYGQNMSELLMMGGYAVVSRDTFGVEKYTPINTFSSWCNILYGDQVQAGLFVGYSKNLGTSEASVLSVPADVAKGFDDKGNGVDHLIRLAPSLSYKAGRLQFCLEYELTIAAYGKYNVTDHLKVQNTKNISNSRVQMATLFYF